MIYKIFLAVIFTFSINLVFGQSLTTKNDKKSVDFISMDINPAVIVVVDSVHHKIDSKKADEIKSKWISKTIIMKDETSKKMYGNPNGVVLIYTKEEYREEVLKQIEQ